MGYLTEIRANWRPLTATVIGLGTGFSFANYTASIQAPHLLAEFGWSKSEFAIITTLSLVLIAIFPLIGRLTDTLGVRKTALIGVVSLPLTFIGFSLQSGDIRVYMALFVIQAIFGITTTTTVYSRIVVQYIENARGLALAIIASAPAVTFAIGGPLLNNFVEANGWQAGYLALAALTFVGGVIALTMLPPERQTTAPTARPGLLGAKQDYGEIIKENAFWIMLVALFLCNLPQVIALTQLNLMLLENGIATADASIMISAFSGGMVAGRFICGLALDRFAPHIVATIGMSLPSIGLFMLASSVDTTVVIFVAVLFLGLAFGAEGDLVAYLVARNFGVRIYSTVLGLMTATISTSSSLGAAFLSLTLAYTDTFVMFLTTCGCTVLVGGLLFMMLKGSKAHVETVSEQIPIAAQAAD